jgi:hypothetical protein
MQTITKKMTRMKIKNCLVLILIGLWLLNGCAPVARTAPTETVAAPIATIKVDPTPTIFATAIPDLTSDIVAAKPCGAPCWRGLVPGQSTMEDVDRFMQNLDPKEWPVKKSITTSTNCVKKWADDRSGDVIGATFSLILEGGLLEFIRVIPGVPPQLQAIVDRYGPPEYISPIVVNSEDKNIYMLELYYPKQGLAVEMTYYTLAEDIGYIRPDMYIGTFNFFRPGDIGSYFADKYACEIGRDQAPLEADRWIKKYVRPWTGFGKVDVVCSNCPNP